MYKIQFWDFNLNYSPGSASELGRQISADPKTPGGPGSCSTIAEEAVDQLQENEKLVAGEMRGNIL